MSKKSNGKRSCPFASSHGYTTEVGRSDWIKAQTKAGSSKKKGKGESKGGDDEDLPVPQDLNASMDQSDPIYYWQLYSIIGQRPIERLVRTFYQKVYDDEDDPDFKNAFARLSGIEHHIQTQTSFWVDGKQAIKHERTLYFCYPTTFMRAFLNITCC
jgi:hypothetical protein